MNLFLKFTTLALLFLTKSVFSEEMPEFTLPEVIYEVEATKTGIKDRKEALNRKVIISREEIMNLGDVMAGDIIKRSPGIYVQGPPGSARNVMLCGVDKEFQSILINGNRPCGGEDTREFKLDRIPVDLIERIEIMKTAPVTYPTDGVAGILNVILKENHPKESFRLELTPAVNTTRKEAGSGKINIWYGDQNFLLNGSFNNMLRTNTEHLADSESGIEGDVVEDCDIRNIAFDGSYQYAASKKSTFSANLLFSDYDEVRDIVQDVKHRKKGGLNERDIITDQDIVRRITDLDLRNEYKFTNNSEFKNSFRFSFGDDVKDKFLKETKSASIEYTDELEDQDNYELLVKSDYNYSGFRFLPWSNKLKSGIKLNYLNRDYNRFVEVRSENQQLSSENESFDYEEYQTGLYLENEFEVNNLSAAIGIRGEYSTSDYKAIETGTTGDSYYFFLNPSLGGKYALTKNFIVKSGYSRQIGRPRFMSVVPIDKIKNKKNLIERGNPGLRPFFTDNFDLSLEYYFNSNGLFVISGYYKDIDDLIELKLIDTDAETGFNIYQFVNVNKAKIWGADFELKSDLTFLGLPGFAFNTNYSYLDSEIRDPGTGKIRRINNQPDYIINVDLRYSNSNLGLIFSIGFNHVGKKVTAKTINEEDGTIVEKLTESASSSLDCMLKYFITRTISVRFNAINILDEETKITQGSVTGTEKKGVTFMLGVKYEF